MEKSKNEENSLAKVMQVQAELLEKLTARLEQLTPHASAEHKEVTSTHHKNYMAESMQLFSS